jgi:hypothetical protein
MLPSIEIGTSMAVLKAVVSFYGFALFVFWWVYKGSASTIYVYLTILLLGLGIDNAVESYARYEFIAHGADTFRFTIWWPLRLAIGTIALFALVGHMTVRVISTWRKVNSEDNGKE